MGDRNITDYLPMIIIFIGADPCVCPNPDAEEGEHMGSPLQVNRQIKSELTL